MVGTYPINPDWRDAVRPIVYVTDLEPPRSRQIIRRRRYGRIEVERGELRAIRFGVWPKYTSVAELWWHRQWTRDRREGDECLLYFNQPWRSPVFLAVPLVLSSRHGSYASLRKALDVLDQVAHLKGSHAAVCEVSNRRISDRAMRRAGWQRHLAECRHRHFIRRWQGTGGWPADPSNPSGLQTPLD